MTNLRTPDERDANQTPSRWIHARHVDYLDEILVNLVAGVYREQGYLGVIVMEPPRHGKSELCSRYFPSWYLGGFPDNRVILVSYEAEFAAMWGGRVRDLMKAHGNTFFGVNVSRKSTAADRWDIEGHLGGMYTAGARGSITGRGANLLVYDDPIKNAEEAQSETIRNKIYQEWKQTFRTRIEPGGVALVIGTRWHEDDLIGRLMRDMDEDPEADKWIVVRLPAVAEAPSEDWPDPDPLGRKPGEVLFPERWSYESLVPHMSNAYTWNALYQQRPAPLEGGLFKEEDLEIVPYPPGKFRRLVRRWDLASTDPKKGEDPDWSVGLLLGEHTDGLYYVLDVERFRKDNVEPELKRVRDKDTQEYGRRVRTRMEREPGSQGKLFIRHLGRTIYRGYAFRGIPSTGNKILRAEIVANATERKEVKVVRGKWNRAFIKEVIRFPFATKDDQVDALSGAYEDMTGRGGRIATW